MIKLFWNTHNQIIQKSEKKNTNNYIWGLYHKDNSDKWIYETLNKVKFTIIENEQELEREDILIIVDSGIENKKELYTKLKLICSKIFLFHLGDESGSHDLSMIYKNCDYVWRTFCLNKYFENTQVQCLPIGYKSGLLNKRVTERKYKWAFIGTPHKSSRHDLIFQLSEIKPSFFHKTKNFNEEIISVSKMSEVLSSTEFIPCPNGFVHPETYRIYEALECGCIPIVENAYKYYDRLFPGNPFIKINKWIEAKSLIKEWNSEQINKKRKACQIWWSKQKDQIQEIIRKKIEA